MKTQDINKKISLASALDKAAEKMLNSDTYQWGHMGACNCGFLAQELTGKTREELHELAMMKSGDWNDQLNDYCSTSGLPMDEVISRMELAGLHITSLQSLERLSDERILKLVPNNRKPLSYNKREDAALYMKSWAKVIREEVLDHVIIDSKLLKAKEELKFA